MITFTCKRNESIVVDDGIIVTVLDIQGPQVDLSIEYPDGTTVYSTELLEAVGQAAEGCGQEV